VRPDLAVCTSAYARESLPPLFPDVPSVVIHPPVLPRAVPSAAAARAELRREQSTPDDDVVIVHVGRMEAWKGQGALVDALVEMRDEPGWTCWFVGGAQRPEEWEYYAWLVGFATRGGVWERIRFLGPRDDVPHVLAAADVFCNPNSGEPFGVAMVEALYAGLPVVSFDAGGALEVVDAGCGLLAPAGATVRLADELRRVVDDPALRARLGAAAPARAAALSDPAAQAARLRGALAGLVGGGAP
jgi:glycosyltransferase involved in cell wall biosynthesis